MYLLPRPRFRSLWMRSQPQPLGWQARIWQAWIWQARIRRQDGRFSQFTKLFQWWQDGWLWRQDGRLWRQDGWWQDGKLQLQLKALPQEQQQLKQFVRGL